jgi:quinol monooxygenase YgiN
MFVVVYHYLVPIEKTKQYILLEKQATKVYMEYGCLGVEIYRDAKDPRRWMEINRFRDREHYNEVIGTVDEDPRIKRLYDEFMSLFSAEEYQPEKKVYFRMV